MTVMATQANDQMRKDFWKRWESLMPCFPQYVLSHFLPMISHLMLNGTLELHRDILHFETKAE